MSWNGPGWSGYGRVKKFREPNWFRLLNRMAGAGVRPKLAALGGKWHSVRQLQRLIVPRVSSLKRRRANAVDSNGTADEVGNQVADSISGSVSRTRIPSKQTCLMGQYACGAMPDLGGSGDGDYPDLLAAATGVVPW